MDVVFYFFFNFIALTIYWNNKIIRQIRIPQTSHYLGRGQKSGKKTLNIWCTNVLPSDCIKHLTLFII